MRTKLNIVHSGWTVFPLPPRILTTDATRTFSSSAQRMTIEPCLSSSLFTARIWATNPSNYSSWSTLSNRFVALDSSLRLSCLRCSLKAGSSHFFKTVVKSFKHNLNNTLPYSLYSKQRDIFFTAYTLDVIVGT